MWNVFLNLFSLNISELSNKPQCSYQQSHLKIYKYLLSFQSQQIYLSDDLLLHQVDTHGYDAHPQEDVDGPQDQLGIGLLLRHVLSYIVNVGVSRNKITKPNGHETNETEVSTIQVWPVLEYYQSVSCCGVNTEDLYLPGSKEDSTKDDVAEKYKEATCDGDCN